MRRLAFYLSIVCSILLLVGLSVYLCMPPGKSFLPRVHRAEEAKNSASGQESKQGDPLSGEIQEETTSDSSRGRRASTTALASSEITTGSISGKVLVESVAFQLPDTLTSASLDMTTDPNDEFQKKCLHTTRTPLPGIKIVLQVYPDSLQTTETISSDSEFLDGPIREHGLFKDLVETVTNADGSYQFSNLVTGRCYRVCAFAPVGTVLHDVNERLQFSPEIELRDWPVDRVDFEFSLGGLSISGCVRDQEGRAIENARVFVACFALDTPYDEWDGMAPPREENFSTLTGADGGYRFDDLPENNVFSAATYLRKGTVKFHRLWVFAKGYLSLQILVPPFTQQSLADGFAYNEYYLGMSPLTFQEFRLPTLSLPQIDGNQISGIDFVLSKQSVVAGHVVDTLGRTVQGDGKYSKIVIQPVETTGTAAPLLTPQTRMGPFTVTFDRSGAFRFEPISPGVYRFKVHQTDDQIDFLQDAQNGSIRVDPGQSLEDLNVRIETDSDRGLLVGRLFDAQTKAPVKAPTENGTVLICVEKIFSPENATPHLGSLNTDLSTGNTFLIEKISPGSGILSVELDEYPANKFDIVIKKGETTQQDFYLDAGGVIRGQILDNETGEPLEDYDVGFPRFENQPDYNQPFRYKSWKEERTQKGTFRISRIGCGTVILEVEASGYSMQCQKVKLVSGETADLTFRMKPDGTVSGTVNTNGKICKSVRVWVRPQIYLSEIGLQSPFSFGKHSYASQDSYAYSVGELGEGEHEAVAIITGVMEWPYPSATTLHCRNMVQIEAGKETYQDFEVPNHDTTIAGSFLRDSDNLHATVYVYEKGTPMERCSFFSGMRDSLAPSAYSEIGHEWENYRIHGLPPGDYIVQAACFLYGEEQCPVMEKFQTATVGTGSVTTVNFEFKSSEEKRNIGTEPENR